MSTLSLIGLRKRFDPSGPWIVDDFTINIEGGEFVTLLGPSGCGKTTVLRMIAGLENPDAGDIRIDGASVVGRKPGERELALVFQQYALYPGMTVEGNLAYPLKALRLPKEERIRKVRETADWLELTTLLDRRPSGLSGGEQQRVAVGRAAIRTPSIYLLDEPLANLDVQLRLRTRSRLKSLHRQTRATTLMVTHDQSEAMALSDRIAVMRLGRLQQIGTPDDLYTRPANTFVAGFIGSPAMNLLALDAEELETLLAAGLGGRLAPSDSLAGGWTMGIRPEDLTLMAPGSTPLQAIVVETEPQGHETLIRCAMGQSIVWIRASPRDRPEPGTEISLAVRSGAAHLFQPDGQRWTERGDGIDVPGACRC